VLVVHPEVADALASGAAVVALESTVFSTLGLPAPANDEALRRCLAAVRRSGAVPAVTAVLDGVARVGLDDGEYERILTGSVKLAERDLGVAVARRRPVGCTTVSASLALARSAGVEVFATGGIGGVHRGAAEHGDVSADLGALARHRVVTVSAGAKAFLDLARTLEELETRSVPVLGLRTDDFPAFYTRRSGLPVPHRIDSPAEAAAVARAHWALGGGGLLVVNPVPAADEWRAESTSIRPDGPDHRAGPADDVLATAAAEATAAGISGAAVTPWILARIAAASGGAAVRANTALTEHNAAAAAEIAVALSRSAH
jgi:pseudouridylate synthase